MAACGEARRISQIPTDLPWTLADRCWFGGKRGRSGRTSV